jgi:hypothetical protein
MLRKVIAASLVLVLSVGVVFAEQIRGVITKVDGNKVSFFKMEGKGKEAKKTGDEITLPVATEFKVVKGAKKGEAGEALEGGLKHKMFSSGKEIRATIITDADNKKITEIRVGGRGGKKNKE